MHIRYPRTTLTDPNRVPPPYHVLHHDSVGFRATSQQKMGCFQAKGAQKENGYQHHFY